MFGLRSPAVLRHSARSIPVAHLRGLRPIPPPEPVDADLGANDFILSILHASPAYRDTKGYLNSFNLQPRPAPVKEPSLPVQSPKLVPELAVTSPVVAAQHDIAEILDPITRHTALVKIQGPFTEVQLESIARGMVYLQKLGLVSVIVVERDDWQRGTEHERGDAVEETLRVVGALEAQGARARPVLQAVARLGPKPGDDIPSAVGDIEPAEAHTLPQDLGLIRSALRAGEIPVLAPFALDSFCRTVRVDANDLVAALARGMVEAAQLTSAASSSSLEFDLTPLRLMIINREGGVPSYARHGLPHLLINLTSELDHIQDTFHPTWRASHPTAISNLKLARSCLAYMPPTSSAVIVSHRSSKSLIANLITNKPAQSSSLPHALLSSGPKALTPHTPTIIRHGLPIRVLRNAHEIDKAKMTHLLERAFGRNLGQAEFYARLEKHLDFVIVAGDYAGAAIVTNEQVPNDNGEAVAYLDKFAVLPEHQGDGTVDFLWVALHDESYGLGLASALNPNVGGMQGRGIGRDLVWRSRVDNPVNKWYFERSSGHLRVGRWAMFWCDAEERVRRRMDVLKADGEPSAKLRGSEGKKWWGVQGLGFVEDEELGRTTRWSKMVDTVPSSWV